ncbi:50S ribosomal protein L3 [Candidatus Kuenenbacteria bacterium CG10_big_fil_rev_8_21_14_0_10_36_11]|uniref:Large ribosomal subunit protein uL3 n=1 Tax=Candidatus Kuenenbacteria bacterium CG10_big_fil_rev_8_21_14_0_10_36_11 TaxID=1974618 RepID=A0A2M6WAS5_9BACT|nr:MAG: 50S ribosomal protein L3 [Candidatus Kuenenbacteria bacterium CG10_big_fil_rev_8_21_14_0_10_36_11]
MKFILGKKIEMSQMFDKEGNVMPVTKVQAGPCAVTQIKNQETDGYVAVQLGFGQKKNLSKALKGHLKNLGDFRYLREFRVRAIHELPLQRGDVITLENFNAGDKITITGVSKGKGFQGVVRRHGFHGHPASHGHKDQERMPGSIGSKRTGSVAKGKRMAGHMGNEQTTVKNLEIIKIDLENNTLYLKGAVPGRRGSLVEIIGEGEIKISDKQLATSDKENKNAEDTENTLTSADNTDNETNIPEEKAETKTE